MSYWVFTDIFEEAGPRFTPFHGGFGLLNYQGIKKPAYYAYYFLNKLGETELVNNDSLSWACKNAKGNMQILLWDYTYTLPDDSINNQSFYIKDLPSRSKGNIKIQITNIPQGKYLLEIYKVGYKTNDAYSTYLSMNKPSQLSTKQVAIIQQQNNGDPISKKTITIDTKGVYSTNISLNENDVFLLNFVKK